MSKTREKALEYAKRYGIENSDKLTNTEIYNLIKDKQGKDVEDAKLIDVKALPAPAGAGNLGAHLTLVVQPSQVHLLPGSAAVPQHPVMDVATRVVAWAQPWAIGLAMGALFVAPMLRHVGILQ